MKSEMHIPHCVFKPRDLTMRCHKTVICILISNLDLRLTLFYCSTKIHHNIDNGIWLPGNTLLFQVFNININENNMFATFEAYICSYLFSLMLLLPCPGCNTKPVRVYIQFVPVMLPNSRKQE